MSPDGASFEPGCYFDSHRGHYIIPAIVQLAMDNGRPTNGTVRDLLATYDAQWHADDFPLDYFIEESDAAIQWLNDHRGVDGHVWEWNDGDFGLYALEQEEE